MKRENLTWQELWPLVGDGQCFAYQEDIHGDTFQYRNGLLCSLSSSRGWEVILWEPRMSKYFKLVDDPSKPKPKDNHLQQDLEDYAIRIFGQLEVVEKQCDYAARKDCIKALVSMFELLRADILREIEEREKK